jgi:hypothetical protein
VPELTDQGSSSSSLEVSRAVMCRDELADCGTPTLM